MLPRVKAVHIFLGENQHMVSQTRYRQKGKKEKEKKETRGKKYKNGSVWC